MDARSSTVEQILASIGSKAHGIVTRAELLLRGVTDTEIRTRLRKGLLIPIFPGVYRVGHTAPSVLALFIAAVKACGPGAVLSGLAAGYLLGLVDKQPPQPEVCTRTHRRIKGIKTRRRQVKSFRVKGIPTTTVAQTLIDIAPYLSKEQLALACHRAGVRYKTTPRHIDQLLCHNSPGSRNLRAVIHGDVKVTLSELERRFLKLLRNANLPLPHTNKPAGTKRVDCRWPQHDLTVELNSYTFHNSYHAWEQDHERRRQARARGDHHRVYTWHDVTNDGDNLVSELRALLPPRPHRAA